MKEKVEVLKGKLVVSSQVLEHEPLYPFFLKKGEWHLS